VDPMLSGQVDHGIGVDTHRDTNTAAIVEAATGAVVDQLQCSTDAIGYKRGFAFVVQHAPGRRVWAIEGTGSYGAGVSTFLRLPQPAEAAQARSRHSD
jgi:transposase